MFLKSLLFCLALYASGACAGDPWDTTDKWLGAATFTALAVDWGQTRYIAKHPEKFYETNFILGEHPSVGRVDAYYATVGIGTFLMADYLGGRDRKWFLGAVLALELAYAIHNQRLGIKVEF